MHIAKINKRLSTCIIIWTTKELNEDINIQKRIATEVIKIETEDDW